MSLTNVLLNWYSSMKRKLRKIPIIDDNWRRKLTIKVKFWHFFDTSPLHHFSKFYNFFWVCWFIGKNLSNFVPPTLKLDNPYYHTLHTTPFSKNPSVYTEAGNSICSVAQWLHIVLCTMGLNCLRSCIFSCQLKFSQFQNNFLIS